jgi:DNA-directed RNA polymerase delta subunit
MGLRDWFKSGSSTKESAATEATPLDEDSLQEQAFAELQEAKTDEALSLFDEAEVTRTEAKPVAAPYDAGDASLDDLMAEEDESFSHVDEVDVVDVASLDDPYLHASIEGDVPEAVVFDEDENPPSV